MKKKLKRIKTEIESEEHKIADKEIKEEKLRISQSRDLSDIPESKSIH